MSKEFVEITGFKELQRKLTLLGDDKSKRSEVLKILGQVANPTVRAAKDEAPMSEKAHTISGKRTKRTFQPGNLKRSIGKKIMTRARNPMLVVRPNSRKSADGFYGRMFIIKGVKASVLGMKRKHRSRSEDLGSSGTRFVIEPDPFMDEAYNKTQGRVTADAEVKLAKYMQRQINRLSNA